MRCNASRRDDGGGGSAREVLAKEKEEESERCRVIITAVEFRVPVSRDTRTEEIEMRAGRIGNEIRHLSDAGCYLYMDAETGSANGEIRAPARKSTLYRVPRCRNFR